MPGEEQSESWTGGHKTGMCKEFPNSLAVTLTLTTGLYQDD